MWIKPARLATALAAAAFLAASVAPAEAALFGAKGKPEVEKSKSKDAAGKAGDAAAGRAATPQERATADRLDPLARVAFWSHEMQVAPTDAEAGVKLAVALRALGRNEEAAVIAEQVLVSHPNNVEALLEDARAKIAGGQPFYAIQPLTAAKAAAPKDWRPLSLLGVAYEQTQRPEDAEAAYQAALRLSPENPAVLANLALMHAARGDKDQAEILLRRAVAGPGAGARERQNLALVLGLQGKLTEAERLMRQDLPPEIAAANLAYLKAEAQPGAAGAAARSWGAMAGQ